MRHIPQLTRAIVVGLLCLYSSATVGLMVDGISHEVEHTIAEHKRADALAAAEGIFPRPGPGKTYGCWPSTDLDSANQGPCPGCSQHQKSSVALIKYSHIFTFHDCHGEHSESLMQHGERFILLSGTCDQLAPEPSTPPPRSLV